jgi:hypothetical protein
MRVVMVPAASGRGKVTWATWNPGSLSPLDLKICSIRFTESEHGTTMEKGTAGR